ncbi:Uncharacterized protein OBRU01_07978 [Operophtera brumata]|uniref:Integral membrane protein GPR155 n=1 Tax=Operophtera brumata TaxID=104452 RepID=A0A0L7L2B0_OPEBR|nr:Uncharacterized protein OBRU01_07978 [Operophtera brumata]
MDQVALVDLSETAADNLYPALFQCFTIILCGYIAGRLNVVTSTESKGIATFVGTFALPSLIFLSLAKLDFSMVNWIFLLAILLAKGLIFFGVMIVTILVSKPVNLGRAGIFAIFCTQSNDFALGYPIIHALYEKTHPEYALYLYLMAPISLAILNPVAFVLMEIHKQKEQSQAITGPGQPAISLCTGKLLKQIAKGIVYNPVLVMTVLGIVGNIVSKHNLSIYLEGLLEVFGQAFSATALFLLGLRMVGQIHRLRGPALVLPCVLIMVKLIVLPVVMRESVSALNAGANDSETGSLSTYAFLYGTIPTAPADYAEQLKRFGFSISIVALVASLWVILVFSITKNYTPSWHSTVQQSLCTFSMFSCMLWTSMLSIGILMLECDMGRSNNQLHSVLALNRAAISLHVQHVLMYAVDFHAVYRDSHAEATSYTPSWHSTVQQSLCTFSMFSCMLWTSMLSIGILMLECDMGWSSNQLHSVLALDRAAISLHVQHVLMYAVDLHAVYRDPHAGATSYTPSWHSTVQQSLCTFSMFSCMLWTSMLSIGILMLECDMGRSSNQLHSVLALDRAAISLHVQHVLMYAVDLHAVYRDPHAGGKLTSSSISISVIWGGAATSYTPSWHSTVQQSLCTFSMFSCMLWTSMLSIGILMLECDMGRSSNQLHSVLALDRAAISARSACSHVCCGPPCCLSGSSCWRTSSDLDWKAIDAIRLCLLVFCLTVTTGCLIVYIRFRRRSAQFASLSADLATSSPPDETTSLVDNADPMSQTQSISNNGGKINMTS